MPDGTSFGELDKTITRTQAWFEGWLIRNHYLRPEELFPKDVLERGDCPGVVPAESLVHEFLREHPGRAKYEQELRDYAKTIGDVTDQW
jgi:hypothetical protein